MSKYFCAECGELSDRGCVQRCRKCTPLVSIRYFDYHSNCIYKSPPAHENYRILWSLLDLHLARCEAAEAGGRDGEV